jgi:hypothetical protein
MALGDIITIESDLKAIDILGISISVNNPPGSETAGVPIDLIRQCFGMFPETMSFVAGNSSGSGTVSATFRLWGMFGVLAGLVNGLWCPLGSGPDATKGVVNDGQACGEVASDLMRHAEPVSFPAHMSRLYCEVTALTGTGTGLRAFLVGRKVMI